ncbi:MAG: hypothetical protein EBR82_48220, partial [Caulobacteraceae bacterium]|nr:hypothetical protein [Caulobacteraceae bacterium]
MAGFFKGFLKGVGETGTKIIEKQEEQEAQTKLLAEKYNLDFENYKKKKNEDVKLVAAQSAKRKAELDAFLGGSTGGVAPVSGVSPEEVQAYAMAYPDDDISKVIGRIQVDKAKQGPAFMNAATNQERLALEQDRNAFEQFQKGYRRTTPASSLGGTTPEGGQTQAGGFEKLPPVPEVTEETYAILDENKLPRDIFSAPIAKSTKEGTYQAETLRKIRAKEQEALPALKDAEEQKLNTIAEAFGISQAAATGLLSGPANLLLDRLGIGSGDTAALEAKLNALAPAARPEGSGATSDMEFRAYKDAFAAIQNPKNINEKTLLDLLTARDRYVKKLEFLEHVNASTSLYDTGKVTA